MSEAGICQYPAMYLQDDFAGSLKRNHQRAVELNLVGHAAASDRDDCRHFVS